MRYRFLKRLLFFLISVSVILLLSVSNWSTKDKETVSQILEKEIHNGRSFIDGKRELSGSNDDFGTDSTDYHLNDNNFLPFDTSLGSELKENDILSTSAFFQGSSQEEKPRKLKREGSGTEQSIISGSTITQYSSGSTQNYQGSEEDTHPKKRTVKKKVNATYSGYVNVHIWEEWCGYRVLDLRRNKHFPLYPDIHRIATRLYLRHGEYQYGQRIFGYVHPPATGNYVFAVSSDDSSEVWLSFSEDPELIQRIAGVGDIETIAYTLLGQFNKYKGQISKPIYLKKGRKYYIEVLHKQNAFKDHILVAWKGPSIPVFKVISSKYLSAYFDEDNISNDVTDIADYIPETVASYPTHLHDLRGYEAQLYTFNRTQYPFGSADSRDDFHKVPFINASDVAGIFPKCPYHPSYIVDFKVKRYEGVSLVHDTAIYPDDLTELSHMHSECETRESDSHGNDLDSEKESGTSETTEAETKTPDVFYRFSLFLSGVKNGLNSYMSHFLPTRSLSETANSPIKVTPRPKAKIAPRRPTKLKFNINKNRKTAQSVKLREMLLNSGYNKRKRGKEEAFDALKFLRQRMGRNRNKKMNSNRRKLLSLDSDGEKHYNYDTDDEGLPSRHGGHKISRPIFVPVKGVENETYSFKAFSSLPTVSSEENYATSYNSQLEDKYYYSDTSSNSGSKRKTRIYINPGLFKMKSAKEVMKYYRIFKSSIYSMMKELPRPDTWKYRQHRSECKNDGNLLLNEKVAKSVVGKVLKGLQKKNNNKYTLKKIVNVEENHDVINGDRYLVELDLQIKGYGDQSFRLSQYLYQPIGKLDLCEPEGLQWNPHSTVHVIIPVKNQGRWVQHFIDNMEKIYVETLDNHLNIIIVDFNSSDIDIDRCLKKSKLPRYHVVHLDGPFQRALGIQAGADLVENPHDIIFTCDLHLEIPSHLIDSIRKHCVEGHMAFAPIVVRLECGYTPDLPYGLWEIQGYGLFAVCKSDFDRVGGMNTKEYKTKWGGEDWEMLDRVLSHGIEVERLRIPKFYHYHHSKKRMWVARNDDDEN